jgi:hypothetical protein
VIRISEKLGTKARISAAAVAAFAAVGLTACAAPGGAPAATVTNTVTQTAPAGQASAAGNSTAAAPSAGANGSNGTSSAADTSATGRLPDYQPSKLVSQSEYSTVLTSPDGVSTIGAFYQKALDTGGWHVASSSMGPFHASFTAYRGHEGASISVYVRLGGSGISISTYHR